MSFYCRFIGGLGGGEGRWLCSFHHLYPIACALNQYIGSVLERLSVIGAYGMVGEAGRTLPCLLMSVSD